MTNTEPYLAERTQIGIGDESTKGTKATTTATWPGMLLGAVELPDGKTGWKKEYARGNGPIPLWHSKGRTEFSGGSLPGVVHNPQMLVYALGSVSTQGTAGGTGASTLNGATVVGATTVILTSATGYETNDYIQIDTGTNAECRKITNVATNTLTLDFKLRKAHASLATCAEVVAPYTHTFTYNTGVLPTFTLEAGIANIDNFVRYYNGCVVGDSEWSCEEGGPLTAKHGFGCMSTEAAGTSLSTITVPTTEPYLYDTATLTWGGSALAQVTKWSVSNKIATKATYAQGSSAANLPKFLTTGRYDATGKMTIVPIATTHWAYIATPGAVFDVVLKLARSATDYIQFTLKNCRMLSAPHNIPEEGPMPVDIDLTAQYLTVEVKDATWAW